MKLSFVILIILSMSICGGSQDICSGNLGENIFERGDFGSGTSPILLTDPNIAPGYNYTTSVPWDGAYTICSSTSALNGLYPTWVRTEDNSDDPNGYMMVVNASYEPGIFYEENVSGLCENTRYEFSADILNLIKIGTANHIDPNVSFLIDNEVVYNTGLIPKTEQWKQFGFSFVTTSSQSSITLTLRNNAPGGGGNDLALDNISFRPCGPSSFIGIEGGTTIFLCIDDDPLTVVADIDAAGGQEFAIQWQVSTNSINWTTIADSTNKTITHTNFTPGEYYYRYYSAGNEVNIQNEKCRIISDVISITILPDTYEVADTICQGEVYGFGNQQLTISGSYVGNFESQYNCDSIVLLDLVFVPSKEILFEDINVVNPSCFGFEDGTIKVNTISGGYGDLEYAIFNENDTISGMALKAGFYSIVIKDKYLCTEELLLTLEDPKKISVLLEKDTVVRLGDELQLNPTYSTSFPSIEWSGQGEFSCSNCEYPVFIPFATDEINVLVTDENGCKAEDFMRIEVNDENFIFLPNIFSPNDDGINDFLTLHYYGKSISRLISLKVFDRWGGLIYEAEDLGTENGVSLWDGYSGSRLVDAGVYFYILEVQVINGLEIKKVGDVTIIP